MIRQLGSLIGYHLIQNVVLTVGKMTQPHLIFVLITH